ncbi:MAG TPA: signal recognition particle-docking protein FtsY [Deltaproteobacteria bacterium]|nr:signal recognition particle-docking protein FtsY [Deltaproteobacteria bacterium]
MNYRFHKHDYIIFLLSYVFFYIYIEKAQGVFIDIPVDAPAWLFLLIAVVLNLWAIPLPGIHPRTPPAIEAKPSELEQIPAEETKRLPEEKAKPAVAVPSSKERLAKGLSKTHKGFIDRIADVFRRHAAIDANVLSELEETLVGTDIGIRTAYKIFEDIRKESTAIDSADKAMTLIRTEIERILKSREQPLSIPEAVKPFVIMVTGVNGSGKTTTIAKIARHFKNAGKSVIIASGDTFRAAAIEQLEHWANLVEADFVKSQEGADPSAVAFDGLEAALSRGHDVLIIDTAGRLHTRENLMEELKKTSRVLDKKLPGAPHEILLVLDATIGQNAIEQTRQFNSSLGITGLVLTKLDGSAKGGVIVGIANEFEIPIRYIGIGEGMDDLQTFAAGDFVSALFAENEA